MFKTRSSQRFRSLGRRIGRYTLLWSVCITLLPALAGFVFGFSRVKDHLLEEVERMTIQEAALHKTLFDRVGMLEHRAKMIFNASIAQMDDATVKAVFDDLFPEKGDGTRRSRPDLFDGTGAADGTFVYGVGAFIADADNMTIADKKTALAAYHAVSRLGPSGHLGIDNFWFFSSRGSIIMFAPYRDDRLLFYREQAPADFSFEDQEFVKQALPENNPARKMTCTSLTPIVYDTTGRTLTSGCQLPVDYRGEFKGAFGVSLLMNGWLKETVRPVMKNTTPILLNSKLEILAHPAYYEGGKPSAATQNTFVELQQSLNLSDVAPSFVVDGITFDPDSRQYIAHARIDGPNWIFAVVVPRSVIYGPALLGALMTGLITLVGMAGLLITLHRVVTRLILRPLNQLANDASIDAEKAGGIGQDLVGRTDEIGVLAKAVNDRDERFRELVSTLEARVERRTAELNRAKEAAEASTEAKSRFLATMSHEIRTPMNGVIGMADALARTPLTADQKRLLNILKSAGGSLLGILNDILDLSKIEAGHVELELMPTAPSEVISGVCDGFRAVATDKGLELRCEIDEDLQQLVHIDPTRLRQILGNLISNAIKFTASGHVTVQAKWADDRLRIDVADTGSGIAESALPFIFDSFRQEDNSTTRRFGGTGLGLSIVRQLSELMGGSVTVRSTKGIGSTFTVDLAAPLAADAVADAAAPSPEPVETGVLNGAKILVAEDNEVNRVVLELLMEPFGLDMTFAPDGAAALAEWKDGAFEAILMDVQMPVMDGLEATRRIRAEERARALPRIPILTLTADAMDDQLDEHLAAGADGRLTKPISAPALARRLSEALSADDDRRRAAE